MVHVLTCSFFFIQYVGVFSVGMSNNSIDGYSAMEDIDDLFNVSTLLIASELTLTLYMFIFKP